MLFPVQLQVGSVRVGVRGGHQRIGALSGKVPSTFERHSEHPTRRRIRQLELTLLPCLLPEEVPLPRPGSPSGGGPDEEEDADLSANRVSPSKPNAHSQSDVPDGAPQGVARGHCLLLALPLALTLISSSFWAMR
uniref:KASH domain-containing protein n=1 Tax=Globodera pallida TaxID=36090 RepID=A0A183C3E8_GLOPA